MTLTDPGAYWEDFYLTRRTGSSGQPGKLLAELAAGLPPGRALDLGSSNGDDVIWLAGQGWQALGLDISATAVGRARARAAGLGLATRARFETRDLAAGLPDERFDLVSAQYLQSPVELPRAAILRAAAALVAPFGHLLVLSHAAPPPWASDEQRARGDKAGYPTVAAELAAIDADPARWEVLRAEIAPRQGKAPDGTPAGLLDTVIHLRRRPG